MRLDDPVPVLTPLRHGTTVLAGGRSFGWAEFGDPDGDPVFWFPGTPGARQQLPADAVDQALTHRLRIIVVERPGTGDSTAHHYESIVDFVPDLEAIADHLEVDKFAAVGLSGGGPFTLACAARLGDRMTTGVVLGGIGPTRGVDVIFSYTLALIPTAAMLGKIRGPLSHSIGSAVRTLGPFGKPFIRAFFWLEWGDRRSMAKFPGHQQQMLADMVDAARRSGVGAAIDDLVLFGRHWGFELSEIEVPITFWGGTSDPIVPYLHAERQAKRVDGARLRTVEGRGHFAGYTEVGEVFDAIREHWPIVRPVESARQAPAARRRPGG